MLVDFTEIPPSNDMDEHQDQFELFTRDFASALGFTILQHIEQELVANPAMESVFRAYFPSLISAVHGPPRLFCNYKRSADCVHGRKCVSCNLLYYWRCRLPQHYE